MVDNVIILSSPKSPFFPFPKEVAAMASSTRTDTSTSLKRTFTLVSSNPPSPSERKNCSNPFKVPALSSPVITSEQRMSLSLKRRYPFCKSLANSTVPVDNGGHSSTTPKVPGFVSIFDCDTDMSDCSAAKDIIRQQCSSFRQQVPVMTLGSPLSLNHPPIRQPNRSQSTSASSSTNSSPTTTISTVESTSIDDQITPNSSPDSPESLMALPNFKSGKYLSNSLTIGAPPSPALRPVSPGKKPRNTKNLSVNVPTPLPSPAMPQFLKLSDGADSKVSTPKSMSAPPSPAFIVPPPSQNPRRRPSNLGLTIKLPGTLRHHQSSPSLFSPGARGPLTGMAVPQSANVKQTTFQFNRPRYGSDAISSRSSSESNSPPRSPGLLAELEEEEEEEDIGFGARGLRSRERGGDHKVYDTQLQQEDEPPRSGEVKSPSYPLGPALIFEPNVYLYSEPNAELASQFDVIINVAREVLNPFKDGANTDGVILPNSPIPQTACTDVSFKTAFEETPLSPAPLSKREPEYVHMPWDHNTPILGDLPALVELISQRSDEGKKILVHCQCGVSRSATLLIAYSMYKHPEQSMQDAYSAVKAKSRWIGPNMSLIYQLTDWKKRIGSDAPKTAFGGWRGGGGSGSSGAGGSMGSGGLGRGGRNGRDTDTDAESMTEPLTAPLPDRRTSPPRSPLANSKAERHKPQMVRTRSENGGFLSSVLPGPSSAPPGMCSIPGSERLSWPDGDAKLRRPSSPELQRESWLDSSRNYEPLEPTRMQPPPPVQQSQCLPKANRYSIEKLDFRIPGQFETDLDENLNVPPTPSILSPRNSGSWPTPIAPRRITQWNGFFADPRSPTERGSTSPVIRNIFDVL